MPRLCSARPGGGLKVGRGGPSGSAEARVSSLRQTRPPHFCHRRADPISTTGPALPSPSGLPLARPPSRRPCAADRRGDGVPILATGDGAKGSAATGGSGAPGPIRSRRDGPPRPPPPSSGRRLPVPDTDSRTPAPPRPPRSQRLVAVFAPLSGRCVLRPGDGEMTLRRRQSSVTKTANHRREDGGSQPKLTLTIATKRTLKRDIARAVTHALLRSVKFDHKQ
ncbi:hypothetical protein J2851_006905 [Azospirillum rugosum]|uniref:Uncharacterized protein n=1 Tax=Azospirillum rugosum TaxID=416170 RepID=A0ABS4SX06_9PROT|nr:hypothetical protein [Azospirillum rugosum]MDQ0530866.1 hypothetical protein [Azospirillum rugosum]